MHFIWFGVPGYSLTALQLDINFMKFIKQGMEIMFSLEWGKCFPVSTGLTYPRNEIIKSLLRRHLMYRN